MMIINPWIFYLIGLVGSIRVACIAFLFLFGTIFGVYALLWFVEFYRDDEYPTLMQILKKWKVPLILSIALLMFMPSEDTIYKMMIALQVTTENIDTAKETIQDVADYIVDAMKEIKEKEIGLRNVKPKRA